MADRKGSALVWAISSMLILAIIVLGMLSAGAAYLNRSLADRTDRQAYLTARSAVDAVLTHLDRYKVQITLNMDEYGNVQGGEVAQGDAWEVITGRNPLLPYALNDPIVLEHFDFGSQDMGEISEASVTRISQEEWLVKATAVFRDARQTVAARIRLDIQDQLGAYEEDVPMLIPVQDVFHATYIDHLSMSGDPLAETSMLTVIHSDLYLREIGDESFGDSNRCIAFQGGGAFITPMLFQAPFLAQTDRRIDNSNGVVGSAINAGSYMGGVNHYGGIITAEHGLKDNKAEYDQERSSVDFVNISGDMAINGAASDKYYQVFSGAVTLDLASVPAGQELYVFIEPGASIAIEGTSNGSAFIYGGKDSVITAMDGTHIKGAVIGANLTITPADSAAQITVEYRRPASNAGIAFTNGGGVRTIQHDGFCIYEWRFTAYE